MHIPTLTRRLTLPAVALLVLSACAGSDGSAGWTYAPLGPSANPSAAASAPASAGASTPAGSGGPGTTVEIETTQDSPIAYNPNTFTVAAGSSVTVDYTNNSNIPHDIALFDGPDQNSNIIASSEVGTGPDNAQTVTFTAPSAPGTYFFWCTVHTLTMTGTYTVQ
jgi:plastocyanin